MPALWGQIVPRYTQNMRPIAQASGEWCHTYFDGVERRYGIPQNTLKAIAFTESGQYISGKGFIAWPWTINVLGKGYIFPTKERAVQAAQQLLKKGHTNFDMGCMQINYRHHGKHFTSLHDAFTPQRNVHYAGSFLRSLYDKTQSWKTAQAHYHSQNPTFHVPYLRTVNKYLDYLSQNQGIGGTDSLHPETIMAAQKILYPKFLKSWEIDRIPHGADGQTVEHIHDPTLQFAAPNFGGQYAYSKGYNRINQLNANANNHNRPADAMANENTDNTQQQGRRFNKNPYARLNTLTIRSKQYSVDSGYVRRMNDLKSQTGVVKIIRR
ncbi:MAG: transglycosylase SLT domain-containing protein [Alphaproteobacteria bacterium]|nr:transglycosylase SLT domain-containing protein [Alphaproteobacteria bacterium]